MKIVATVGEDVVLVQMTHRELARLAGKSYERELPEYRNRPFDVGREYSVHATWDRLEQQGLAAQKLDGISKTLAALADLVKQTEGALVQAVETKEGGAQ